MKRWIDCILVAFIFFLPCCSLSASVLAAFGADQPPKTSPYQLDSVKVMDVVLIGNKVTKDHIILRELGFRSGDKLVRRYLNELLEVAQNRVFNTDLFITVQINTYAVDHEQIVVVVEVIERWYLIVVPLLDIGDRNINEWLRVRGGDLRRLEYGIKFKDRNFRGRRELLKADLLVGFTKNIGFQYELPYINRQQKTGIVFGASYSQRNVLAFKTSDNIPEEARSDRPLIQRVQARFGVVHRSQFYNSHLFNLEFYNVQIADTVAWLNPDYFGNGRTVQRYFELSYSFSRDRRDVAAYPLKGYFSSFLAQKRGLGIFDDVNQWVFEGRHVRYHKIAENLFYSIGIAGKVTFPRQQPYSLYQGLGYRQLFVTGYDIYVIDGQWYTLSKNTFRWKLLEGKQNLGKIIPLKQFSTVPYAFYFKMNFDAGYVRNNINVFDNRRMVNRPIFGANAGFDLVSFYNSVLRIEYAVNSLKEGIFAFHYSASL